MSVFVIHRTDENDWSRRGSWPLPAHRGGFEAVHSRHVHIEENNGELLLQQTTQSFATRSRANQILIQFREVRLVREKLVGPVVDKQDINLPVGSRGPVVLCRKRHQR